MHVFYSLFACYLNECTFEWVPSWSLEIDAPCSHICFRFMRLWKICMTPTHNCSWTTSSSWAKLFSSLYKHACDWFPLVHFFFVHILHRADVISMVSSGKFGNENSPATENTSLTEQIVCICLCAWSRKYTQAGPNTNPRLHEWLRTCSDIRVFKRFKLEW